MPVKRYKFKANYNPFIGTSGAQSTANQYIFLTNASNVPGAAYTYPTGESTFANIADAITQMYSADPLMDGKVKAIGYGWQKFIVDRNSRALITVRGGCGGHAIAAGTVITYTGTSGEPSLGKSGSASFGGRGAKLSGEIQLYKGDVLYILVGNRGYCGAASDGSWGESGGGATVILRENPAGAFTFQGKAVDVLFVAGGGGGASSCVIGRNGGDANPNNGVNTNAGAGSDGSAGSGLTGTNTTGSGTKPSAILANVPGVTSNASTAHNATWAGGGGGWYSGGGGGGYSGGNGGAGSSSSANGGTGGTSYMNPTFVKEIFRGHEYDASIHPWSIPGEVTIDMNGKDESEFFLAVDPEGTKAYSLITDQWELIPNQNELTPVDYESFGTSPEIKSLNGLIQGKVRFLVSSPNNEKFLNFEGMVNKQVIRSNFEMDFTSIQTLKSWNVTGRHDSSNIKVAVSTNHGMTYKILQGNIWTEIDINDREAFYNQGIDIEALTTIPDVKWKELSISNLRFAFLVHQVAYYNNPILSKIELLCDLTGGWRKAKEVDYDYEYISPEVCKLTIHSNGDYKINYLNRISGEG
jgi:hypothetical protein